MRFCQQASHFLFKGVACFDLSAIVCSFFLLLTVAIAAFLLEESRDGPSVPDSVSLSTRKVCAQLGLQ